ncbi:hypothetical protein SFRURICE_001881 [Spodoptera frugiperda]|nr:hypothetical protein SFRURICE_001881 [Spodoptera frugiperda]
MIKRLLLQQLTCLLIIASSSLALQFPPNPTSDMSADEKLQKANKTLDQSDESGHEVETEGDEVKEKKFLDDAMRTVLDPNTLIVKTNDIVETFKYQLDELDKVNASLDVFMDEMDKLSLDVCKTSQQALWSYVTDINNETKKNKMVRIAAEEDEIKKQYWDILKKKYLNNEQLMNDPKMKRKIRIIKERGTNVQMPQSKQREEIDTMQRIWSRVTVCAYNMSCGSEDSVRTMSGNLWAQEWQAIYPKVAAYTDYIRPKLPPNETIHSKDLFDAVDEFHQSLGFESAKDSYQDIKETMTTANCLPSSHDMCDGVNYKIKWCGEKVTDIVVAFHDAISDIVAVQLTSPEHLKTLNLVKVETGPEVTLNHLLWVALEKFPLMAYAYVLDKWRWDVFGNSSLDHWNQHWWDLRIKETGVSPPVLRNESDLDPAAKYHVVSHVQYITYLISHVLEFQILLSLCKKANHTGPLHECSIYGVKEAGKLLSDGMALGASEDWRTVLQAMTGETELSTEGILQYFADLQTFLKEENSKLAALNEGDMDQSAPIIVGAIVVLLTILIIVLYCVKKHDFGGKVFSACGLSKNGSLDIVTNELPQGKTNEVDGISEDKV